MAKRWIEIVRVTPLLVGVCLVLGYTALNKSGGASLQTLTSSQPGSHTLAPLWLQPTKHGQSFIMNVAGGFFKTIGQRELAGTCYQGVVDVSQELGDRPAEATALEEVAFLQDESDYGYDVFSSRKHAISYYEQALKIWQELGSRPHQAKNLRVIIQQYKLLGDTPNQNSTSYYKQALQYSQKVLPIFQELGDPKAESETLRDMAYSYKGLGKFQLAIDTYKKALEPISKVDDSTDSQRGQRNSLEAKTLDNIASLYEIQQQPQQALNYYKQSLEVFKKARFHLPADYYNAPNKITILNKMANIYYKLGDLQNSIHSLEKAIEVSQNNSYSKSKISNDLAYLYNQIDQPRQALGYYQKNSSITTMSGPSNYLSLDNLAYTYDRLGQPQESLKYRQKAVTEGVSPEKYFALDRTALQLWDLGEPKEALVYYQQALAVSQSKGDPLGEAKAFYNLAAVKKTLGDFSGGKQDIQSAIKIVENIRDQFTEPDLRNSYMASVQKYYQLQDELLTQTK